jgi:hypothetical protein
MAIRIAYFSWMGHTQKVATALSCGGHDTHHLTPYRWMLRAAPKPLLDGTGWTLSGDVHTGTLAQVLSGSKPTLDFDDDGRITGPVGCNRYFGPVYDDGNIAFDRFGRVNEDALRYTGCDAAGEHLPCTY